MGQRTRTLVLGGGGAVGIAWECGLLAGLAQHDVDLAAAERIVGTSAGSVVGARLALGQEMARPEPPAAAPGTRNGERAGSDGAMADRLSALMEVMAAATREATPEEGRAVLGQFAMEQRTTEEESFIRSFADLAGRAWPSNFECTAVNARTGAFVVWDAATGIDLQRAVAASCSVPGFFPPVTVDGDRFVDGGIRSPLNTDLVAGDEVVLVVSVVPTDIPGAMKPGELDALRRSGSAVEVVDGDAGFLELAGGGAGVMDLANGPAAYDLGWELAARVGERVGALWND